MSKRKDGQPRGKYTLEFKLEAVRLVKGGQAASVTAQGTWHSKADAG
jgi:transposase-like protein